MKDLKEKLPKKLVNSNPKEGENIYKVTIKAIGELNGNHCKCEITKLYKDSKGKNKVKDISIDIKDIVQEYFAYLSPADKEKVYLKSFHPSSSTSSSSSSSSHSRKEKKSTTTIFDKDAQETKKLMAKCIKSIQKDIDYVKVHNTLYNDKNKLRVKITIYYNKALDLKKNTRHMRINHLKEIYLECIKMQDRPLIDIEPKPNTNKPVEPGKQEPSAVMRRHSFNDNLLFNRNPVQPGKEESPRRYSVDDSPRNGNNNNNLEQRGIMGLERRKPLSANNQSDGQCGFCVLF